MCQKKIIIFLQKLESLRILIFKIFCDKIYKALLKNKDKKMVIWNGQEQLDLIYDLLLKGVGTSELQKLGINISKLSIVRQCKLAEKLIRSGYSKENLSGLGISMDKFPIQEQIKLNTMDARLKNQQKKEAALEEEIEK